MLALEQNPAFIDSFGPKNHSNIAIRNLMNSLEGSSSQFNHVTSSKLLTSTHMGQKKPQQSKPTSEWEEKALRVCGNWSEQMSSKGKIYYYNCVSEVSQWQKPSDWSLPDVSKSELLRLVDGKKACPVTNGYKRHSGQENDSDVITKRPKVENGSRQHQQHAEFRNRDRETSLTQALDSLNPSMLQQRSNAQRVTSQGDHQRVKNSLSTQDSVYLPPPPPPMPQISSSSKHLLVSRTSTPATTPATNQVAKKSSSHRNLPTLASSLSSFINLLKSKAPHCIVYRGRPNSQLELDNKHSTSSPISNGSSHNMMMVASHPKNRYEETGNSMVVSNNNLNNSAPADVIPTALSYKDHRKLLMQKSDSSQDSPDEHHRGNNGSKEDIFDSEMEAYKSSLLNGCDRRGPAPNRSISADVPNTSSDASMSGGRNSDPRMRRLSNPPPVMTSSIPAALLNGLDPSIAQKQQQLEMRISAFFNVLQSSEMQRYVVPELATRYTDEQAESLERESKNEMKNFDRLQSILFSELTCELKKLRALVTFSEIKLDCQMRKEQSTSELADMLQNYQVAQRFSFSDGCI